MSQPRYVRPPVPRTSGSYETRQSDGVAAPEARPPTKRRLRRLALRTLMVTAAGTVGLVAVSVVSSLNDPAVGDCVRTTGASGFEVVDCGSNEAQFRIVGVEGGSRT